MIYTLSLSLATMSDELLYISGEWKLPKTDDMIAVTIGITVVLVLGSVSVPGDLFVVFTVRITFVVLV